MFPGWKEPTSDELAASAALAAITQAAPYLCDRVELTVYCWTGPHPVEGPKYELVFFQGEEKLEAPVTAAVLQAVEQVQRMHQESRPAWDIVTFRALRVSGEWELEQEEICFSGGGGESEESVGMADDILPEMPPQG